MKLGIRTKLFLISFGLIVVSVFVSYYYLRRSLGTRFAERVTEDLRVRAALVAERAAVIDLPREQSTGWDRLADHFGDLAHARVTLIANDGTVLGDSDVPDWQITSVENYARRPEVEAALRDGEGASRRVSDIDDREMLYVARPIVRHGEKVGVARVALPLVEVDAAIASLQSTLAIAGLLGLAVSLALSSIAVQLASRKARSLTTAAQRMADGDLATRVRPEGSDEFAHLGGALDELAQSLSSTLAALESERDRLSGILSGMQEGVLFLDHAGRVVHINPALREMLLLGNQVVGKTLLEVVRHADLKELLDDSRRARGVVTREIETSGLKPRRVLVRVSQLEGDAGGLVAVFVDVTEMRRLESMRREFVANVSHELRTPVTAIRSAAETLQSALTSDPGAADRFIGIIDRNAERLHGLVEDLLDLSRIESQKYRLHLESLDLNEEFSHAVSLFRERAEKKGISLEHGAPASACAVRADRRALEHIMTNLVDNAVKYCPSGARIRMYSEESGNMVRVLVADDGPGIESRHLPRLFERFYRVDAGRSRELGGTGLALSIVKHLVESMGGSVSVESNPGEGTVFGFTLAKDNPAASVPPPPVLRRTA